MKDNFQPVAVALRSIGAKQSGVYLIREQTDWLPELLYVGESHSGRLKPRDNVIGRPSFLEWLFS